jgi:repressor of nif and glnA expression
MTSDLDERTYDLLRLVDRHEPVGSIRLVELLQRRGYSITSRTVRLTLSELDERGLTRKVPGRGRRLTEAGRVELRQGNVTSRLARIRSRIAALASRTTHDPTGDPGTVISSVVYVDACDLPAARKVLGTLSDSSLGPLRVRITESKPGEPGDYRIVLPSSLTLKGVLLSAGIDAALEGAGLVDYRPATDHDPTDSSIPIEDRGGAIERYVDVVNSDGASLDVVTLLIESGRTDVLGPLGGSERPADYRAGVAVVDSLTVPLPRLDDVRRLAVAHRRDLGGILDVRRPREPGPFPIERPDHESALVTFGGAGELALAALVERSVIDRWETLYDTCPRCEFGPVDAAAATLSAD